MNKKILVFIQSKDRAFQLDGCLGSFYKNCLDNESVDIKISYSSSSDIFEKQYLDVSNIYNNCIFIKETNLKESLINSFEDYEYILFLSDISIFIDTFYIKDTIKYLINNKDSLLFSLLLGKNITKSIKQYSPITAQNNIINLAQNINKFCWSTSYGDFKSPIDFAGSIYRLNGFLKDIILNTEFTSYESLEKVIYNNYFWKFNNINDHILCYENSVLFCNKTIENVHLFNIQNYSIDQLAQYFAVGYRLKTELYFGFLPEATHQQVEIFFTPFFKNNESKIEIHSPENISIIIPCFNQEKFIKDTLVSLTNQSYKNFEILVINDGSNDNTGIIVKDFINNNTDYNIKIIEKENAGVSNSRNIGIKNSKYNWVYPLDSDDIIHPDFLLESVAKINNNNSLNLISTLMKTFGRTITSAHSYYSKEHLKKYNTLIYSTMYKKELWEKVNGYNEVLPWGAEDWDLWLKFSELEINFALVEKYYFFYRTHRTPSLCSTMLMFADDVYSCLKTIHLNKYDKKIIMDSHLKLLNQDEKTFNLISKRSKQFPEYYIAYFWKGLYYENKNPELAIESYNKSISMLNNNFDWQPFFRLAGLYKKLNLLKESSENFLEYKLRSNLLYNKS